MHGNIMTDLGEEKRCCPATGDIMEYAMLYGSVPPGTMGTVIRSWTDPNGYQWVRLHLGENLSGHKLLANVPVNVLRPRSGARSLCGYGRGSSALRI